LDVSIGLLSLRVANCRFAVKSGGHGPFYGASNINGGVTIDLLNMNQISVSADKTQTLIEPGNRWVDVYSYLQPKGLTVIGGRVSDIGVGGLTLGGGISFFSGRYGWACDNVNNYQVSTQSNSSGTVLIPSRLYLQTAQSEMSTTKHIRTFTLHCVEEETISA
jgi:FAD/FMN-containing dehydrogenase